MIRKIKYIAIIAVSMLFMLSSGVAFAKTGKEACSGYESNPNFQLVCRGGGESDMQDVVRNVLSAIFGFIGIIAAVMIIIGGVKYSTSAGDPGKVQSAKNTIMFSIIGLIVALSAFAITNFILGALV